MGLPMLRVLTGWKGYTAAAVAGAALLAGAAGGVWLYGEIRYRAGESAAKAEQRMAELESFRVESQRLASIAAELHATTNTLRAAAPGFIEAYTRETILSPLPADCVPGAGRLRVINDAIRAANTAAGAGRAVPAGAGPGGR